MSRCPGVVLRPTIDILPEDRNDWQLYFTDDGLNMTSNDTADSDFSPTVLSPGFYWYAENIVVNLLVDDMCVKVANAGICKTGDTQTLLIRVAGCKDSC